MRFAPIIFCRFRDTTPRQDDCFSLGGDQGSTGTLGRVQERLLKPALHTAGQARYLHLSLKKIQGRWANSQKGDVLPRSTRS